MPTRKESGRFGILPPEAAFVVQLQSEADVAGGDISGRVEHVVSGRATRFQSVDELLRFIRQVLGTPEPGGPPGKGS